MEKNYFESFEINSIEELKKAYYKLVMELHPDRNKDKDTTKEFQEMSNQYEKLAKELKNKHITKDGKQYTKETEYDEKFKKIIDRFCTIDNIKIDVVGSFIWIYGERTKDIKEELKKYGFKWNGNENRKKWMWSAYGFCGHYNPNVEYKDIQNSYGLEEIEHKHIEKLED